VAGNAEGTKSRHVEANMTLLAQQSHGHDGESPARSESLGALTAQLSELVSRLVRDEMALAQVEAKQRAKRIGFGVGAFGAAGILAFFGACCGVAAAVIGLSNVLRPWFAAIVVGAVLFLVAGLVVLPGWKGITQRRPDVPHESVESLKADVAAVKQAVRR
jgi:hypothetical protein